MRALIYAESQRFSDETPGASVVFDESLGRGAKGLAPSKVKKISMPRPGGTQSFASAPIRRFSNTLSGRSAKGLAPSTERKIRCPGLEGLNPLGPAQARFPFSVLMSGFDQSTGAAPKDWRPPLPGRFRYPALEGRNPLRPHSARGPPVSRSPPDVVDNTLIFPILRASHQSPTYRIQPYIGTFLFIMLKVTNLSIPAVPLPDALLKAQKFPHFAFPILDPQLYWMRWPLSRDRE